MAPEDDPRWLCSLEVDLGVLDLRDPATRRALDVSIEALRADWAPELPNPAAMRVAATARELGVDGVVVPSAARDGGWNLAVLPQAFERVRVVSRRRRVPRPPSN